MLTKLAVVGMALTALGSRPVAAQCEGTTTYSALLAMESPDADRMVAYGTDPLQVGELRAPLGDGPFPVVIALHGGCWLAAYDLDYMRPIAAALAAAGFAVWMPEYRRLGDDGGGWPGTFQDVAAAADYLRGLATELPLDLGRVVVLGHSAGGHLGLWLAARRTLPPGTPVSGDEPLPVRGVVSLSGIPNLREAAIRGLCHDAPSRLLGADWETAIALASPVERLPLGVPLRLIAGDCDTIVPADVATGFAVRAAAAGDDVAAEVIAGAGHFDLVSPAADPWPVVVATIRELVATPRPARPADAAR